MLLMIFPLMYPLPLPPSHLPLPGGLAVRSNVTKFLGLGPSRTVAYTASPQFIMKVMGKGEGEMLWVGGEGYAVTVCPTLRLPRFDFPH